MKKIGIMALVAVAVIVAFSATASAEEIIPIEDFKVVKDFPSEMIAGSTYEAIYQFTALQSIPIQICLKIEHPTIEKGEWSVKSMGEIEAGIFWSDVHSVKGLFEFKVEVSSSPNIIPAEYNLTMELWSERVKIYPPEEPEEVPPEKVPEEPPEELPTGGIRVTDALSSDQNWQVVFVAAIGALGVATMLCVRSFIKPKKSKKTAKTE